MPKAHSGTAIDKSGLSDSLKRDWKTLFAIVYFCRSFFFYMGLGPAVAIISTEPIEGSLSSHISVRPTYSLNDDDDATADMETFV